MSWKTYFAADKSESTIKSSWTKQGQWRRNQRDKGDAAAPSIKKKKKKVNMVHCKQGVCP